MVFDYLEYSGAFFDDFVQNFFSLPEGVFHEIDFLVLFFEPKYVEDHEAKLIVVSFFI